MKFSVTAAACLAALCMAGTVVRAQQDSSAEVDKIFAWAKADEPGCAVAVSREGQRLVNKAYGLADMERGVQLSPSTVFDVASVRKQFVAAALLLLEQDGKLSLSDDVRKHIPELPDYGHKITIDNLLTHTSGIRDWQALLNLAGGDPDAMTMIVRQRELNSPPGEEWSYSNSNFVLAPEIVKRVSGMPFSDFARTRIFEPLGMKSTSHPEDPLFLIKNRALAYSKSDGKWKMDMYLGNERGGAGALFTTAADLTAWYDGLLSNKLGAAVTQKLQEPVTLKNGRKLNYARGLNIELRPGRGGRLVWHSGGGAGYSAIAGHLPERRLSVAITCNQDGAAQARHASRLFDLFLPLENLPVESPPPYTPPGVDLTGRAGTFFNEQTGDPLRLAVNNKLLIVAGGGPLVATSADRFRNQRPTLNFMSEARFDLQFLSADRIEIKTTDGVVTRYRRAKAWRPNADELKAFTGRFFSEELTGTFEVMLGKQGLSVRANYAPKAVIEFAPVEQDTFQAGQLLIRFKRDTAGKIVGLELSNPLLRNVKFAKVG